MKLVKKQHTYRFKDFNEYNNHKDLKIIVEAEKENGYDKVEVSTCIGENFEVTITYELEKE